MPITLLPSGRMSLESAFPWRGLQRGHGKSRLFQSFDEIVSEGQTQKLMKKLVFQIGGPASFAASLLYEGRRERVWDGSHHRE